MSNAVTATGTLVKVKPAVATILTSSVANPTVLTFSAPHGFQTGDTSVVVAGHSGSTPAVNGTYTVTRINATQITVPVNVTVAGTGGTATPPAAYATIGELRTIKPPSFSRNEIDSTNHNDGAESKVLGILRQGNGTFSINYLGAEPTHVAMLSYLMGNAKAQWQFVMASGVTYTAQGFVRKFELAEATVDSIQSADVEVVWSNTIVSS